MAPVGWWGSVDAYRNAPGVARVIEPGVVFSKTTRWIVGWEVRDGGTGQ